MPVESIPIESRIIVDLVFLAAAVGALHYRQRPSRDFIFTFVLLHITTFLLTFLLSAAEVTAGFGLGLFAIFGILRYRTEAIKIADLTWFFLGIGLAVSNAFRTPDSQLLHIIVLDSVAVFVALVMSWYRSAGGRSTLLVTYDRLDRLGSSSRDVLKADLEERLGVNVDSVHVGPVDMLRETVVLTIVVRDPK